MSATGPTRISTTEPRSLADTQLPMRVRSILETLLRSASSELERRLEGMLVEFEQQLFRLADHARNPAVESGHLQTLRTMRLNRADLIPRFMLGVEAGLARLDEASQSQTDEETAPAPTFADLSLVDDTTMDADLTLRDIAQRSAAGASLPLHLLGQRFGVLAAAPAFDAERLPLGPWSLCKVMHEASDVLQLPQDAQQLLLRTFERRVMAEYGELAELFNVELVHAGVLPALTYVPLRVRTPVPATPGNDASANPPARERRRTDGSERDDRSQPHTRWTAANAEDAPGDLADAFGALQDLLASRRGAAHASTRRSAAAHTPRQVADPAALAAALTQVRSTLALSGGIAPTIDGLHQEVLQRLREQHGPQAVLSQPQEDTFDLLGMLYERIEREVRIDTLSATLLKRLQLPVLQAALGDQQFFTRPQHPARQLLNAVADSGARWLDDNEADPALLRAVQRAVEHVVRHAHQDASAFETSNRALQNELEQQARRSEMAERRHVEAARGKEKLEVAKRTAADTIAGMIGTRSPQRFVRALVEQTWADVLALTLLRHGQDSQEWREMLEATRRIVAASCEAEPAPDPELAKVIESALGGVGYHADEAAAISYRLASLREEGDGASRTELAAALKARARLGEGTAPKAGAAPTPRTAQEEAQYQRVRVLPFGTWIEFVTNQQGDMVRKRLSWYSVITGHALFVNLRGQRVGEQSLDTLARMLARGQARVVTIEHAGVVDRAWQATLGALRSLARRRSRTASGKQAEA
jgi:hypothetical protein